MTKKIKIHWEGPLTYNQGINEYKLDNDKRCDFGIYQIYGSHIIYSNKKNSQKNNVLLYIGKTVSGSTFSGRIASHGFCHSPEFEIYLGRVEGEEYDEDIESWENDIGDAEKILINKYAPSYNSEGCGDLRKDQLANPLCQLINSGCYADLDINIHSKEVVYQPEI